MRRPEIHLLSPPFAGHLHPILGMAEILRSDYEVCVVTTPTAARRVGALGFETIPILAGWEADLEAIVNAPSAAGSNPWRLLGQLSQALKIQQQVRVELEALYRASRPSLMIADFTLICVGPLASELGIAWWTSLPSPCVLDGGDGPPCYLGGLRPMKGWLGELRNRIGWASLSAFKYLASSIFHKKFRRIGLASVYRQDGSESAYSNEAILAMGWPELEFRTAWPKVVHFVPPLLFSPTVTCPPPHFTDGRKHVLVTLGTHLQWIKDRVACEIERLASLTPQIEYHFSDGNLGSKVRCEHQNFQRLPYVDYQLIGRYDLVVHHAGAGVAAHCLSKGCPAVVYPMDFDQFDNAARLEHAGYASRVRRLSQLSNAIGVALDDIAMRERCERFSCAHSKDDAAQVLRAKLRLANYESLQLAVADA